MTPFSAAATHALWTSTRGCVSLMLLRGHLYDTLSFHQQTLPALQCVRSRQESAALGHSSASVWLYPMAESSGVLQRFSEG